VGIISDALPAQRLAIEKVFPEVPHCLCHFHFYSLVLKKAKIADSSIVTEIRQSLRKLYDLKQFKVALINQTIDKSQYSIIRPFFEIIEELSNWHRKPKDSCFTGLILFARLSDIKDRFLTLSNLIQLKKIKILAHTERVINRILPEIIRILDEQKKTQEDLSQITQHLKDIVQILNNSEEKPDIGLSNIRELVVSLLLKLNSIEKTSEEYEFITALSKYIDTKGDLLFNYRNIEGAPSTNNFTELKFKQLKHLLRRTIGHSAAKEFLFAHGNGIMYINPTEGREKIQKIFMTINQGAIKKQISLNRAKRDSLHFILHDQTRWDKRLIVLDTLIQNLEMKLTIKV
jgi:hypothetical protein